MRFLARLLTLSSISLLLNLSSCGYHAGTGGVVDCYSSVCIPMVTGDVEGHLTAELVKELTRSSHLSYEQEEGDLILLVEFVEAREENVGYRFERTVDTNTATKRIVPTEGRLTAIVSICVTERCSGKTVIGPTRLAASVDYDHDYYTNIQGTPRFSLGQLEDTGVARDSATLPLDKKVAERVVEYLNAYTNIPGTGQG